MLLAMSDGGEEGKTLAVVVVVRGQEASGGDQVVVRWWCW